MAEHLAEEVRRKIDDIQEERDKLARLDEELESEQMTLKIRHYDLTHPKKTATHLGPPNSDIEQDSSSTVALSRTCTLGLARMYYYSQLASSGN